MARKPPPPHPKGAPKTPGSGRKKGTPNKRTVALRELMAALSGDVYYQEKLREDFRKRRVHPSVELRVWEYAVGSPKQQIEMSAELTVKDRIAAERERLRCLDVVQLEKLVAESDALIERALAEAEGKRQGVAGGREALPHAVSAGPGRTPALTEATAHPIKGTHDSHRDSMGEYPDACQPR